MKKIFINWCIFIGMISMNAQTKEELHTQKAEKQADADAAQGEANALQAQIDALPGWRKGAFGTIGGSLSNLATGTLKEHLIMLLETLVLLLMLLLT